MFPNIEGFQNFSGVVVYGGYYGAFSAIAMVDSNMDLKEPHIQSATRQYTQVRINAYLCNSVYGNSTTVQPSSVKTHYLIKY